MRNTTDVFYSILISLLFSTLFFRKSDENSTQQIQFLSIQDDFQENLSKMRSEIIDLHQSLEEKIKEIDKKNFIISELQLQNDKLDSEITDKGKVRRADFL